MSDNREDQQKKETKPWEKTFSDDHVPGRYTQTPAP